MHTTVPSLPLLQIRHSFSLSMRTTSPSCLTATSPASPPKLTVPLTSGRPKRTLRISGMYAGHSNNAIPHPMPTVNHPTACHIGLLEPASNSPTAAKSEAYAPMHNIGNHPLPHRLNSQNTCARVRGRSQAYLSASPTIFRRRRNTARKGFCRSSPPSLEISWRGEISFDTPSRTVLSATHTTIGQGKQRAPAPLLPPSQYSRSSSAGISARIPSHSRNSLRSPKPEQIRPATGPTTVDHNWRNVLLSRRKQTLVRKKAPMPTNAQADLLDQCMRSAANSRDSVTPAHPRALPKGVMVGRSSHTCTFSLRASITSKWPRVLQDLFNCLYCTPQPTKDLPREAFKLTQVRLHGRQQSYRCPEQSCNTFGRATHLPGELQTYGCAQARAVVHVGECRPPR